MQAHRLHAETEVVVKPLGYGAQTPVASAPASPHSSGSPGTLSIRGSELGGGQALVLEQCGHKRLGGEWQTSWHATFMILLHKELPIFVQNSCLRTQIRKP